MNQSESTLLALSGSVGVADIAELHSSVVKAVEEGREITFDFSQARDVDASILQLLLASNAATKQDGVTITMRGVSETLAQSFEHFGAGELLSLIENPNASGVTEQVG